MNIRADIIIVSYNTCEITCDCIDSIYSTSDRNNIGIIVVDNASNDATIKTIQRNYPNVKTIVNSENLGYAKAVNIGSKASTAPYIILSNSDVIYYSNSIDSLLNYLVEQKDVAVVGPGQIFPNNTYQYSFGQLPSIKTALLNFLFLESLSLCLRKLKWKYGIYSKTPRKVGYVDGAVMALRKDVFDKLEGFDEDYFFYTEEADYCKRVQSAGYRVCTMPSAVVTHLRGASISAFSESSIKMLIESKMMYCRKHLNAQQTRFYISSEIFSCSSKMLACKIFKLFTWGTNKIKFKTKAELFYLYKKHWTFFKEMII